MKYKIKGMLVVVLSFMMVVSSLSLEVMDISATTIDTKLEDKESQTTLLSKKEMEKAMSSFATPRAATINVPENDSLGHQNITQDTVMTFNGSATITGTNSPGISIADGKTLTIVLTKGQVNVNAGGIGYAGIRLPKNAKLIVKGNGELYAKGGNGIASQDGTDAATGTDKPNGGRGGNGGSAPGAGIGGNGGNGGTGGEPGRGYSYDGKEGKNGNWGSRGGTGSSGDTAGTLYILGTTNVIGQAGIRDQNDARSGGNTAGHYGKGDNYWGYGAGGGAGGDATSSAGIGGGGAGGGAGGGGGSGMHHHTKGDWHGIGAAGGGGGQGVDGGAGGISCSGYSVIYTINGTAGSDIQPGIGGVQSGQTYYAGGGGGNGGYMGTPGDGGSIYKEYTANYETNTSGSKQMGVTSSLKGGNIVFLSECTVELDTTSLVYTGNYITPRLIIKGKDGKEIPSKLSKNYTVTYSNNSNVGTATATIASLGLESNDYYLLVDDMAKATITYDITQATDTDIILNNQGIKECVYGSSLDVKIANRDSYNTGEVTWEYVADDTHVAEALFKDDDKVAKGNMAKVIPTKVGKLKIKATIKRVANKDGSYNYKESVMTLDTDIDITQKNIAELDIVVPPIPAQVYTGQLIKPKYNDKAYGTESIKYDGNVDITHPYLIQTQDYTLTYGDELTNLNAAAQDTGIVKIEGTGNYKGTKEQKFKIDPIDISTDDNFSLVIASPFVFTGDAQTPSPTLTIRGNEMPNTDYVLMYKGLNGSDENDDLTNVGRKKVTVNPLSGNLTGTKMIEFEIIPANIADSNVEKDASNVYFDAKEIESRPKLSYKGFTLTEDGKGKPSPTNPDDYTLGFSNHKLVGEATITIKGKNNFEGSKIVHYNVLKRPLYILPDVEQWKYYGQEDIFGINQNQPNPTYRTFIKKLNDEGTSESEERIFGSAEDPIAHLPGFKTSVEGNLSREDKHEIGTYKYLIGGLQLKDDKTTGDYNTNYQMKIVDNESYYTVKEYIFDDVKARLEGTMGKNDWYVKEHAKLVAPDGFWISAKRDLVNNEWKDSIAFPDADYSKTGAQYFLRNKSHGAISSAFNEKYKQDTTNPKGNVVVNDDAWAFYNAKTDFIKFLNSSAIGSIYGQDGLSQIRKTSYFLSDKILSVDELNKIKVLEDFASPDDVLLGLNADFPIAVSENTWINKSQFDMAIDKYNEKKLVVYGRVEDFAGNVTYVSSDGIVFDKDAPLLKAEYKYDEVWTTNTLAKITGSVSDHNSGLKDRYVAYQIDNQAQQIIREVGDFSINELIDGDYILEISAWDKADNKAVPISFHVMKDTKEPRILLDGNTTEISTSQEIKFILDIGASKEAKLEVSYNDGAWKVVEGGTSKAYIAKENGTYRFRVSNGAGVTSKTSSITFTKIDNNEPKVKVFAKDSSKKNVAMDGATKNDVTVTFANITENLGESIYEYSLNNGATWIEVTANLDREAKIPVFDMENEYHVKTRITAKNGLMDESEFSFMIDRTAPSGMISIENVSSKSLFSTFKNKKQKVAMNAIDSDSIFNSGVSKVEYFILSGKKVSNAPDKPDYIEYMVNDNWQEGNSCTVSPSEQYIVYYKIMDKAGNITYIRSDRIIIDDANPVINVKGNEKSIVNEALLKVSVEDENPGLEKVTYFIDDGIEQEGSENFEIRITENGDHVVTIKAQDLSGNVAETKFTITVNNAKPTITAVLNGNKTDKTQGIDVEATYMGVGNINHIYRKIDNEEFIDITSMIKKSESKFKGEYIAEENGNYTFRVETTTGAFAQTNVVVKDFEATDVLAKVVARKEDGTGYKSQEWTNQDVNLSFSNSIANLNGLSHYLKKDEGNFELVNAVNGYVNVKAEQTQSLSYKVGLVDKSKESDPLNYQVNIDKINPTGSIVIKDKVWNGLEELIYNISFKAFFKEKEKVSISAQDTGGSKIDKIYYFVEDVENLPESLKGNMDASSVEDMVKGRWIEGDETLLNPNGSYVVLAKITDKAGNATYLSTEGVIFDDISPNIDSDINQSDWYTDNVTPISFMLRDGLSDMDTVTYKIQDATKTASLVLGKFSISTSDFPQGESTVEVTGMDKAGNKISSTYQLKKDAIQPTIAVEDITANKDFVVRERKIQVKPMADASGILRVEVKEPDAGGWKDITNTYKDGYYAKEIGLYNFRVINGAGIASNPASITLGDISQDVPVLTYLAQEKDGKVYLEKSWVNDDVYVKFQTTTLHKIKEYLYKIDDGAYQSLIVDVDNSASFTSSEGMHQYTMKAIAENGLESEEISLWIGVDKDRPTIRVNSDLDTWVKETTLLEVEVIDNLSGVGSEGYSFDGGHSWQSTKKENVYANKIVDVQAKDAVSNTASKGVAITKIDSQGPNALSLAQVGKDAAKTRNIKAKVEDYKDISGTEGSGVKDVYVMTSFPYKNGVFAPNPSTTFNMEKNGEAWETEKPVSVAYDGTSSIWLVTTDNVDNIKIYSSKIDNMIGTGDQEGNTEDPDNPSKPDHPDTPENPGTGGSKDPTKPGEDGKTEIVNPKGSGGNQNSSSSSTGGKIILNESYIYKNIIDNGSGNNKQTNQNNKPSVNNDQMNKDVLEYIGRLNSKKNNRNLYAIIIPWILIILLTILALHRHRKFRLRKKELEELEESREEELEYGKENV